MKNKFKDSAVILDFKAPLIKKVEEHNHAISTWRGFTLEYSSLSLTGGYDFKSANNERHYFAYHDMMFAEGEMEIDGSPIVISRDLRGKMTYVPSGRSFSGWAAPTDRKNTFTTLSFNPELIGEELETVFAETELEPMVYFENTTLKSTMLKLQGILKSGEPATSLYKESLGLVAAMEIQQAVSSKKDIRTLARGGLSYSQQSLLRDYIRLNLANDIMLDDMAALAGMSRFHFSRSFKESFGDTPVRYINRERLTLAQALLAGTRISISEIAENTGFGSVQHFIKVFKDVVGVTPTDYRKQS